MMGLLCLQLQSTAQFNPYRYQPQKKAVVQKGAVVSAHPLASEVGLMMLKRGGNAIDAAIATQLALAVVYPGAGNIGGGGFLVAHLGNGKNLAIDYREKAPLKASRDMYLDSAGKPQLKWSQDGHLATGVPGTVAGLFASLKYARLPFKTLVAPAILLAKNGFAITEREANELNELKKEFLELNSSKVAFVKEGLWQAGDTLRQPELAATLQRLSNQGARDFYEGTTAHLIAAEMSKANGIISLNDLKAYKALERKAVEFDYKKQYHLISMPLPSSGGIILQQLMGMVEDRSLGSLKFQSAASVQLMIEAERRAYADRAEYLGDADFVSVPVSTLISKPYLQQRMTDYTPGKAGNSKSIGAGMARESKETTHISIIDNQGNAVSVTTTLNGSYGSRTVVSGAGFILNNQMDDFSVKPGVPNMYGAVGNEANAIAPEKRMLSSMTPTIVLKNNKPYIVVGTPGGTTIPTSVFQTIMNVIEFGLPAEEAVNLPKFHHQWLPDVVYAEPSFNVETRKQLEAMGYRFLRSEAIGRTELIVVEGKKFIAIGDSRGDDSVAGY